MSDKYDFGQLTREYEEKGYVIVEGIFSPHDIQELRDAAQEVTDLTRQGQWPHRRIVGKQFPPFDSITSADSWGVQHLMHPDLPNHDLFRNFYGSSPLLDVAAHLLHTTEDSMQLELFNLLIEPKEHCFALGWHRDDIRPDVSENEEQERLAAPTHGIQWNACLFDDDCLFIVPKTHKRSRTPDEVKANNEIPPSARKVQSDLDDGFDGAWDIDPSETMRVSLKAGQTVFYSQRILHRASYLPSRKRATLHGCYGDVRGSKDNSTGEKISASERARNVLQHGVEWMKEASFGASLPSRLQPLWRNLIDMSQHYKTQELGFSLRG